MTCLDISDLRAGEKPLDGRDCRVGDEAASSAADEERWSVVSHLVAAAVTVAATVREGEVGHVVQCRAEDCQRDPEFERVMLVVRRTDEVREEKLADWEGLYIYFHVNINDIAIDRYRLSMEDNILRSLRMGWLADRYPIYRFADFQLRVKKEEITR